MGIPVWAIDMRVEAGRLHVIYRGVYAVGHTAISRDGRWMAAVLAAGEDAVLSHRSAAALWKIADDGVEPEVTADRSLAIPGLRTHRAPVPADEQRLVRRIPVTTPSRTLLDLSAVIRVPALERAYREAHVLNLGVDLEQLLDRYPGRRGCRAARGLLGEVIPHGRLEQLFRKVLKRYALPLPDAVDVQLPWGEGDCVWWAQRLNVELDGNSTHRTRAQFERDRSRDQDAAVAGWLVIRVTWRQLKYEPKGVADRLRAILAARSGLTGHIPVNPDLAA